MDPPAWPAGLESVTPESPPPAPPPPPSSPQNLVLTNHSLLVDSPEANQEGVCVSPLSTTGKSTSRSGDGVCLVGGPERHHASPPLPDSSPAASPPSLSKPTFLPAEMSHFSRTLVLDTGAFLRLKRLDQFGRHFVVPPSVLGEIRDARARAHVAGVTLLHPECDLPTVMSATEGDKRWARKFASMTGDLGVLSGTDLDVIALTYMLQRRTGRVEKLRTKPPEPVVLREPSAPTQAWDSRWWDCSKSSGSDSGSGGGGETEDGTGSHSDAEGEGDGAESRSLLADGGKTGGDQEGRVEKREFVGVGDAEVEDTTAERKALLVNRGGKAPPSDGGATAVPGEVEGDAGASETREIVEVADGNDDGEGVWITSENLSRFKRKMEGVSAKKKEEALVACMTTDYSVQNVLLQMGLDVITIDGLAVRSVKSWALICRWVKSSGLCVLEGSVTALFTTHHAHNK